MCSDNPSSALVMGAWGAGTDNGDKDFAKAFTSANKQILAKALGMSTIEDEREDTEVIAHEPDHKPKAVRDAEAMTDVAIKSWADSFNKALKACKNRKELSVVRAENAIMMKKIPEITRDYFGEMIAQLEGALE